ncbi:hypothetical protein QR680_016016 [Steinernema hermaphroditum]|uniref:Uncharacterized protein n=1 Tax=Steinernema hermaphroditum TaxID=289476 RepID=A0AA39LL81_9BILA|nr:hypothetical protein QR680_016016 [Steinernema hermaphroditum]
MSSIDSLDEYAYTLKILILGDSCVGKSNLVLRLCEDRFDEKLQFTIGLDFKSRVFNVNGDKVLAKIIDTAGQERFHSLTPSTYRNLDGVALVYSVMDTQSYCSVQKWMNQVTEHTDEDIPIVLIANVTDRKTDRMVTAENGRRLAQRLDLQYFEVSAKTGKNVTHALQSLVNLAYLRRRRKEPTTTSRPTGVVKITADKRKKIKVKQCCK